MGFFVKIADSVGARRRILESSKDVIHMLKGYYHLLEIREEKKAKIEELRTALFDLGRLTEELQRLVPEEKKAELEQFLPKSPSVKSVSKKRNPTSKANSVKKTSKKKKKEAVRKKSEVEILEESLSKIEERLKTL